MQTPRALALSLLALAFAPFASAQSEPEDNPAPTAAPATTTFAVTPAPLKESFHIYLLMGQSNMAGHGKIESQTGNPRVLALNADSQWVVAREPIHSKHGRTEPGAGPGIPFALEMIKADPKVTIGLIPCAVGGSPLKRWVKKGDLYELAVSRAKAAAGVGTIKGVLWHQGESDSANRKFAESYHARLAKMIGDLRHHLGQPNLPVVVGQLGDFLLLTPEKYAYAEDVRTAIKNIPTVVPNTGFADSAGLNHKGDKLHFDADAAKQLGVNFAKAMQGLQKK